MPRSPEDWHARFRQQAGWTAATRQYLLNKGKFNPDNRILEVGCGTGVITSWLVEETGCQVVGLDINPEFLWRARSYDRQTNFCLSNVLSLPFQDCFFDAVVCHYFLLWIGDPKQALSEMVRTTCKGGKIIAFAEPDYGGRIDAPEGLVVLGRLQAEALRQQGAYPERGRGLAGLFSNAGLDNIEIGIMGGQWFGKPTRQEIALEWEVLEDDLKDTISQEKLELWKAINLNAWETGERVLYVPTFYASGMKKDCQKEKEKL